VLHRDLKPDNVVVTGASLSGQDDIWDDLDASTEPNWALLLARWHVTLIDFGFARALSPSDMSTQVSKASSHTMDSSSGSSKSLNRSMSRKMNRMMSAVGNRMYAAPEVQRGITKNLDLSVHQYSSHLSVDVTKTLAENVSLYGLTADAYSLGNTLIHMMTGTFVIIDYYLFASRF